MHSLGERYRDMAQNTADRASKWENYIEEVEWKMARYPEESKVHQQLERDKENAVAELVAGRALETAAKNSVENDAYDIQLLHLADQYLDA